MNEELEYIDDVDAFTEALLKHNEDIWREIHEREIENITWERGSE